MREVRVLLLVPRSDVLLKVNGSLGEAALSDKIYAPILDLLADHKPKTLAQIEQLVKHKSIALSQIIQAILALTGTANLGLVQDDSVIAKVKVQTEKLNAYLCNKARGSNDIGYLASPVTGGGFAVNRFQQLFLLSLAQGKKHPAEWSKFVWQIIASQGQKLIKEGRTLETAEENLAELTDQATSFAQKQLPILQALQIA